MARPVTTLLIFFLAMNLFAGLLMNTGVAADMGIETNIGGDTAVENTTSYANDTVDTGTSTGSTLFGMYNVLTEGVNTIISTVTAGHIMLAQAGVPTPITNMLNVMFGVVIALDIISFARGWGL